MKRFRFNIGTLVILVLFFGVGLAALRESNEIWDSSIFMLTLGVLLTSILFAIHRAEKRRAFGLGFALFGSAYLALSLLPSIESRLITTKALAYLDSKVPGRPVAFYVVRGYSGTGLNQVSNGTPALNGIKTASAGQGPARLWDAATGKMLGGWSGTTENFVRIGHSLFALLAGWLGGQLSRRLCRSSSDPERSAAVEAPGTAP
jgi:hypothetical protein